MRDRPSGAELLEQARATLLEELLDHLPAAKRYTGLMVANAMAIAMRELLAGEGPHRAELTGLAEYYGGGTPKEPDGATVQEALLRLNRRLAEDLRVGRLDAEARVFLLLRSATADKLRESNPKALHSGLDG
jgi:hypothetical protein